MPSYRENVWTTLETNSLYLHHSTQVTNAKLQALVDIAEALNKRSMAVEAEAHRRAFQMSEIIVLFADISSFHAATHELLQLESAIQLLLHGFLTQTLLPYPQATAIIEEVTSPLLDSNYLQVINPDPLSSYQDTRITAYRLVDTLHILLKIKVSSFTAPLMLFRLDIFPVE
jgi:hypothetical protein